ncbi:MAG: UDP-3-O-(3-hydroxymyristoyl)glucosamine N-acyltransferase [Methylovulum sp.]|uniref:UDP-3-O-(3-hydroxymyristoyl)glucosamine N-acyltransferase n=1 Tax=Methylovulum sp. TaxID=1916980 RepID=UPI00262C42EA|nr:UDP-3-O-(3-hydroxymyristoyl)glucosamine N-acyltransferase [Methylovulum sp.]MDD2724744.1 UDP-3-O-(3-hydroxymyristoyl)glucosamine N-acyltransferase [Methylovulum sp.]MDD5124755.1 UDP-3-O-(3-hydroxymyristoyl)glucosamine N-acyltransferase [Methylovulum sp.]
MSMTLKELADACNARIEGGDSSALIASVADISSAGTGQVTQLTNSRYAKYMKGSTATACFVPEDFAIPDVPATMALLITQDPEMSFIKAIELLHPERAYPAEIAGQAVLAATVSLGDGVFIGPYSVIGENTCIGDGTAILAGAYIGRHVKIGKNCRIYPYVVIYDDAIIGDNVIIHSGAVIGADGFGYKFRNYQHVKVPQIGNVVIEDNVEIGANTCIDRGALGGTTLGTGSKIDNLVQIGHNNKIGRHVIMCGQVGVSGSCNIEDYAILAGSAGIADHVTIGQGAVVMARAGVAADVAAKTQVFGSPAKDKRTAYKEQVALSKLPELLKKVKWLEEQLLMVKNK